MSVINTVLGVPFGYIMYFCYIFVKNYGMAIILFTLVTKIILLPVSIIVQKNSVRMVRLKPELDDIKLRFAGDKDKIAEEQIELYKREKYSPAMGCLPTFIQIPMILGLINVIYNPLQHLLHIRKDTIEALTTMATQLAGVENLGFGAQLRVIEAIKGNPAAFGTLRGTVQDFDAVIASIQGLNLHLWSFDLSKTPSILQPDILILIPILSILSTLIMCIAQNYLNVLQREQSAASQWGMAAFLTAFSGYFTFLVPAGVGLYWSVGNLSQILVMLICNVIYNPRRYIDYQNRSQKQKLTKEEKAALRQARKENAPRSKADRKRFYSIENKQLVFVSPSNGYFKYFKNFIAYVTENSDIVVHYVTSDPKDQIFNTDNPQILPYYIDERAIIPFMMKMDADIVVMTIPDLGIYHIKRSLVRKDVEYIFADHAMNSLHLVYREGALDNYDTIFAVHAQYMDEVRASEKLYGTKEKKLIPVGYNLIDNLVADYEAMEKIENEKKVILVAPSWQKDNLLELCLDPLLEQLTGRGYKIIVRPHPEFIKRFPDKMRAILKRYEEQTGDDLIFETDFTSNTSIFTSDMLITDWSAIAIEFSYTTLKPSLFINTPMKIMNPNYKDIPIVPLDIALRDMLGVSVDPDKLDSLAETVAEMFDHQADYEDKILETRDKYLFNLGESGRAGGEYIIQALKEKEELRRAEELEYV